MAVGQLPQARDGFVDGMVRRRGAHAPDRGGAARGSKARRRGPGCRPAGLRRPGGHCPRRRRPRQSEPRWPASGYRRAWRRTTTPGRARTRAARSCPPEHTGHTVDIIKDESSGRVSQTAVCDRRAMAPSGKHLRVSYPVSDSMSCIRRAKESTGCRTRFRPSPLVLALEVTLDAVRLEDVLDVRDLGENRRAVDSHV